jgi:hypothetical protein
MHYNTPGHFDKIELQNSLNLQVELFGIENIMLRTSQTMTFFVA